MRGDVRPELLGLCDAHDHLFLRTPLLLDQELDDPAAAAAELAAFASTGGRTLVQWTPKGLGRRPDELARLSRTHGLHLVAATGLHARVHYGRDPADLGATALTDLFVTELQHGMAGSRVRAGLVKVATAGAVDGRTRTLLRAAARAHARTGAPVAVHVDQGTAPQAVLDELCLRSGMPPAGVLLGHLGRRVDVEVVLATAAAGTFLALDGPSVAHPDATRRFPELIRQLVAAGHQDQLLLGADTTRPLARATAGGPGAAWVSRDAAALLDAVEPGLARRVLVTNPARALAAPWSQPAP